MKGSLEYDPYSQAPKTFDRTCAAHLPDYQFCAPHTFHCSARKTTELRICQVNTSRMGGRDPGAAASALVSRQKFLPKLRDNTCGIN